MMYDKKCPSWIEEAVTFKTEKVRGESRVLNLLRRPLLGVGGVQIYQDLIMYQKFLLINQNVLHFHRFIVFTLLQKEYLDLCDLVFSV